MRIPLTILAFTVAAFAADEFVESPDHLEQPNVPRGVLTKMEPWKSKIFEGTTRDWWVYVPAQYRKEKPAAVMVFQIGRAHV